MAKAKNKKDKAGKDKSSGSTGSTGKKAAAKEKAELAPKKGGTKAAPKKQEKGADKQDEPATGFNRIPRWLHQEKGLSDTLAGSVVVLVSGLVIMGLVFVLSKIWPAGG